MRIPTEKIDPDHKHLRFTDFFENADFLLIFMLKLDKPFKSKEMFIIYLFFNSSDLGFESKKGFFLLFSLIFRPVDPHILRIRIQVAKMLRIQRIQILSTGNNIVTIHTDSFLFLRSINVNV